MLPNLQSLALTPLRDMEPTNCEAIGYSPTCFNLMTFVITIPHLSELYEFDISNRSSLIITYLGIIFLFISSIFKFDTILNSKE
jgi:hypothetical protein